MNYEIDKYLNMIGYSIQLPDNKYDEIKNSYNAISEYISNNNELAQDVDCNIYYHGSFAINTVIKPLRGDDFDLDMIVEFDYSKRSMSASEFYNMFYETFSTGRYKDMLEKYRNNVRLNYNTNYHFDIMPSVPLSYNSPALSVPDAKRRGWVIRSPKTFIEWFNNQINKVQGYKVKTFDNRRIIMESTVTPLKKPAPYEMTPTLIRVVQLLKRMKDIYFRDYEGDREPQSIVVTTLAAKYYNGELSVYDALLNIVKKMKQLYDNNNRFVVPNPSYPNEIFTEKWPRHIEYYDNYRDFIYFVDSRIKCLVSSNEPKKALSELFGQSPVDDVYNETRHDSYWQRTSNITKDNVFPNEQVVINKKERGNA